ncbi:MAG: M13 family metallopeptidase, partial [Bacteroidia bacterium]
IEKAGLSALQPELDRIDGLKSKEEIIPVAGMLCAWHVDPFFDMMPGQDGKNSSMTVLMINQGGLGMPGREYYLNTDERTTHIRNEYMKHLEKTFELAGKSSAEAKKIAADIFSFEERLAKASRTLEQLRDPYANYNKRSVSQLEKAYPSLKWTLLLDNYGIKNVDSVVVGQPEFLTAVEKNIKGSSLETLKNYLKWSLVSGLSPYLGKELADESFRFNQTVLAGVKTQKPRWKRVIDYENRSIGELLGQQFVKEVFSPKAKARYEKMVKTMIGTYAEHIKKLDWMSDVTKEKALLKLSTITPKVGYPDKWKDFSSMDVSRNSFVRNVININKWWSDSYIQKIGKPVDRTEWDMPPQEYNAYYNPSNNEIVLPAAQFAVPGYADEELDDALVYGYAAASTIGHELTHGFDDEGRQFDEKGNLKNWWTKEDEEKFNQRTKLYIEQFNNYVVLDSMHVRGQATLGENIADLGGVVVGLDAFKKTEQYKKGEKINGYTPVQRFFLGYALGWLGHMTDDKLANLIITNVHAPGNLRVNGPYSNVPEFYEAFGVKEGKPMWRADSIRVRIW